VTKSGIGKNTVNLWLNEGA